MDHPRRTLRYVHADDLDSKPFEWKALEVVDPQGEKLGKVDGFIIDILEGRPYHVVVESGHWFKHKYFLLPVGHVVLDRVNKTVVADISKERVQRFPGFNKDVFAKLSEKDLDLMAQEMEAACYPEVAGATTRWDTWKSYDYPSWWEASFYRPDRIDNRDEAGITNPGQRSSAADRTR